MIDDLVEQWDEYVESAGFVMGEVEDMAQKMRNRLELMEKELLRALDKRDKTFMWVLNRAKVAEAKLAAWEKYRDDCAEWDYVETQRTSELDALFKEFFTLLDKTEQTDEGHVFHPNHINSCRAEDGQKLENLLRLMKAKVEGRQPLPEGGDYD